MIKQYLQFLTLLFVWLLSQQAVAQSITLPIEVIGVNGDDELISFDLNGSGNSGAYLYLQVNNFSYDDKVAVKFNSGNFVNLKNSNVNVFEPGKSYGGIGGGYSTIELTYAIPAGQLNNNSNTITFRFNRLDDISSGYRIISMNVLDAGGVPLISQGQFQNDNPATWSVLDPSLVTLGENLWNNADLKSGSGQTWKAKCASCHAQDGRDLKYFNYSDKSIIERAKFHDLTETEGEAIASYIRNLNAPAPADARPWNPPYQPGPGLDSKSPSEWAAGAGLNAVLKDDGDMLPYLFPNGTDQADIDQVASLSATLNIREIPVAIQFPDWKHWLPAVHPMDMMNTTNWNNSTMLSGYTTVRSDFTSQSAAARNNNNTLIPRLNAFSDAIQNFLDNPADAIHPWTTLNSAGMNKRLAAYSKEEYKLNIAKWQAVKHWEIMQEFDIEGEVPNNRPYAEARQWPSENWVLFQLAPHIVGDYRGTSHFVGQDPVVGYYESTVWYQVQLTLNAGMRRGNMVETVDWAYNYQHVLKANEGTGIREPLRYFQNLIKGYQQRDNGKSLTGGEGWTMREVSPWRVYSKGNGYQDTHAELDNYEAGLRAKVTNAMIKQFVQKVNSYNSSDWARAGRGQGSWQHLENANLTPQSLAGGDCLFLDGRPCTDQYDADEIDAIYTLLPLLENMQGIDCGMVSDLATWCKSVWPGNGTTLWDTYINGNNCGNTGGSYNLVVNSGDGDGTYAQGTQVTITAGSFEGWCFDYWTGDTQYISNVNNPTTTLTMPGANVDVTARFKQDCGSATYTLTVNNGTGGGTFSQGDVVTITAGSFEGWCFDLWEGDNQYITDINNATTTLTMPAADVEVEAWFTQNCGAPTYTLTVNSGSGSGDYEATTVINIAANTAPAGQEFDQWTGDVAQVNNVFASSTTFTMPSSVANVTATYKAIQSGLPTGYVYLENRETGRRIRPFAENVDDVVNQGDPAWTGDFMQWTVEDIDGSMFYLVNKKNSLKLWSPNSTDGDPLQMKYNSWTGNKTRWEMVSTDNGYFHLKNVGTGMYVRPSSTDYMNSGNGGDKGEVQNESASTTNYWTQWKFVEVNGGARFGDTSEEVEAAFSVYPNPTSGVIYLSHIESDTPVRLSAIDGTIIMSAIGVQQLDLSKLNKGIYILTAGDEVRKLIRE